MERITIHCIDCHGEGLLMMNCNMVWDSDKQQWDYHDNPSPEYYCTDCGMQNIEYKEVPITEEESE